MTKPHPPTADELAQLRADALAQVPPLFAGHPEYAVGDATIVDPCIADTLRPFDGQLPPASRRDEIVRSIAVCIENALRRPDGLELVANAIAARYAHPVITRDGDRVTIDAGVVAGPLQLFRAVIESSSSPHVDRGEWQTTEVVRFLKLGIAKFPDARTYTARVEIPRRSTAPEWSYTYDRGEDRVRVLAKSRPDFVYVSEKLGGDPSRATSLHTLDLHQEKAVAPPPWR